MPKDLRIVVPVITPRSDPQGRQPPSGFLFPQISRLGLDDTPQLFGGIQKLVQQVYLEFFTDTLPNGVGSGMARKLRAANSQDFASVVRTETSLLLDKLLAYQDQLDLPPDERIADLTILEILYDEGQGRFAVSWELTTEAGDQFVLRPPLV